MSLFRIFSCGVYDKKKKCFSLGRHFRTQTVPRSSVTKSRRIAADVPSGNRRRALEILARVAAAYVSHISWCSGAKPHGHSGYESDPSNTSRKVNFFSKVNSPPLLFSYLTVNREIKSKTVL